MRRATNLTIGQDDGEGAEQADDSLPYDAVRGHTRLYHHVHYTGSDLKQTCKGERSEAHSGERALPLTPTPHSLHRHHHVSSEWAPTYT